MNNYVDEMWMRLITNSSWFPEAKENVKVTVSRQDYETFCKEFIFNSLKDEHFGESFCKRFGISDLTISILKDEHFTKQLIESLGYIDDTHSN